MSYIQECRDNRSLNFEILEKPWKSIKVNPVSHGFFLGTDFVLKEIPHFENTNLALNIYILLAYLE